MLLRLGQQFKKKKLKKKCELFFNKKKKIK